MYIIIAGCGRLGTELALRFSDRGDDVVVVDDDISRFAGLGDGFNGITVAGIPFDEDVMQEAGIRRADAVAAVTSDDNVNIMISQIAKMLYHVHKIVTRISAPQKVDTFAKMGFQIICPTAVAAASTEAMLLEGEQK